jgi:hypothetical protein
MINLPPGWRIERLESKGGLTTIIIGRTQQVPRSNDHVFEFCACRLKFGEDPDIGLGIAMHIARAAVDAWPTEANP